MNCEKYQELISAFIDGELTAEESINLQNHLDQCPACRRLMEEVKELHSLIASEDKTRMPIDVEKQILIDVSKRKRDKKEPAGFFGGYYRVPRGAVWAALVLLVLLAVNSILSPFSPPGRAEISYDHDNSRIKVQKVELTEADIVGVRTFTGRSNGS